MKRFIVISITFLINLTLCAHPWKPNHYVIIDTDGGIDDIRTITMLLASPDVRVLAITVSPGVLSNESAYKKVRSLLNSFHNEGLPVGINRKVIFRSPGFQAAQNTEWGSEAGIDETGAPDHLKLISDIITAERTEINFICLGGLSTAYSALKEIPAFKNQVKEIIWSAAGLNDTKGFNYCIDIQSAEKLLNEKISVRVVKSFGEEIYFDEPLLKSISEIPTIHAKKITSSFNSENIKDHKYSYSGNDEMAAMWLHYPELFQNGSRGNNFESTPLNLAEIRNNLIKLLAGQTVAKNQVIKDLPSDPSFYFADIEPFVTEIISSHGMDEWVSGVLANELHRHLGVFAIIGVKMGIRAREYFATGIDEFRVRSLAGSVPPLSCMNDGIQVSTGATPGHGLLSVENGNPAIPAAEFTYMNRKIKITLLPEISEKITAELKEINFVYGLDSNIYWELVRKNSIKYWKNLDRQKIFTIEEVF